MYQSATRYKLTTHTTASLTSWRAFSSAQMTARLGCSAAKHMSWSKTDFKSELCNNISDLSSDVQCTTSEKLQLFCRNRLAFRRLKVTSYTVLDTISPYNPPGTTMPCLVNTSTRSTAQCERKLWKTVTKACTALMTMTMYRPLTTVFFKYFLTNPLVHWKHLHAANYIGNDFWTAS